MEDLRDLDAEPDEPQRPRVCFDERPCQWLGASREPWPRLPAHPTRFDDAYTRHGTCHVFVRAEPFQGWRHLSVPPRRTTQECAQGMAELVDVHLPKAAQSRVVLDHLSTQTPAALYEVLPPADAGRMRRKLELHLTPVPGRWLRMAELELAVLARQCLNRRVPDVHTMGREGAAWEARRNRHQAISDGRCTTTEARLKLTSL